MTTYPSPSDPVSALTRADGTTQAHSTDHGRIIGAWENVKHHGARGNGVDPDSITAVDNAIAALPANGGTVFFPDGQYRFDSKVTDGTTKAVVFKGAGVLATEIVGSGHSIIHLQKNWSGVRDLNISQYVTDAATIGLELSNPSNGVGKCLIEAVHIGSVAKVGTALQFDWGLENTLSEVSIEGWDTGAKVLATGGSNKASNANCMTGVKLRECNTGMYVEGVEVPMFGCTVEGNVNYGIDFNGGTLEVFGTHFENTLGSAVGINIRGSSAISFASTGNIYSSSAANKDIVVAGTVSNDLNSTNDFFNSGVTHGGSGTFIFQNPLHITSATGAGPRWFWEAMVGAGNNLTGTDYTMSGFRNFIVPQLQLSGKSATPVTGVAINAAAIHAALVSLGFITA